MPSVELAGKLTAEDTSRNLLLTSRYIALQLNPTAFSQSESTGVVRDYFVLVGELIARYDIDESRTWRIERYSGTITYEL